MEEKTKYNRIKVVLAEKDITQKELAEKLEVGTVSVSRWCTNDVQPDIYTFYKIADFLGVPVCELLAN